MWKVSEKCPYSELFCSHAVTFSVSLRIQSECGKILTRKAPNTDSFHAVDSYCQSYFQKNTLILYCYSTIHYDYYQFYKKRFTNYTRNVLPIIQETFYQLYKKRFSNYTRNVTFRLTITSINLDIYLDNFIQNKRYSFKYN